MEQRKIVLLGKTGDGKSSAGNTILRKKQFIAGCSSKSVTDKPARGEGLVNGRNITVIDTPGFFDTDRDEKEIKSEIINSLIECAPAVHAFVIILKVGRYTKQEEDVVQQFLNTMKGEHVLKHTVILFTHGDQLECETIEEFVKDNSNLQELVDNCGGHCHVIDNKYWNNCDSGYKSNKVQVKKLLETIDKMVKKNGCFSTDLLQHLEKEIQEDMKNIKGNLPPEEKREIAKNNVYKKFMVQAAGATTGALIGAFLGLAVPLVAVLALLNRVCPLKPLITAKITAAFTGGAAAGGGTAAAAGGGTAAAAGAAKAVVAGGAAAVEAVVAGGAAVEAVVAGGTAAVEAVVAGAGAGAAAVEAAVAGGAAAAVETGTAAGGAGAAAGAGFGAGPVIAASVLGVTSLVGAVGGGVAGWKAAEEADSVYDAMSKSAKLNFENAAAMIEKGKELVSLVLNTKLN